MESQLGDLVGSSSPSPDFISEAQASTKEEALPPGPPLPWRPLGRDEMHGIPSPRHCPHYEGHQSLQVFLTGPLLSSLL